MTVRTALEGALTAVGHPTRGVREAAAPRLNPSRGGSGGALPPQPKFGGSGGQRPPAKTEKILNLDTVLPSLLNQYNTNKWAAAISLSYMIYYYIIFFRVLADDTALDVRPNARPDASTRKTLTRCR